MAKKLQKERLFPKKFRSGTSEYPTPIEVFNSVVDDFVSQGRIGDKACFKAKEGNKKNQCEISWYDDKWFSLSWCATDIKVSIGLPYKDSLDTVLGKSEMEIPPSWKLERFKRGKRIQFRVSKEYANTIGPFLDLVFRRLYDYPDGYTVVGYIPLDEDHFI